MEDKEYKISLNQQTYQALQNISNFLDISMEDLISIAIDELLNLIEHDPHIFLENIGFTKKLKAIINDDPNS
mgnify:CR=1 FL=1